MLRDTIREVMRQANALYAGERRPQKVSIGSRRWLGCLADPESIGLYSSRTDLVSGSDRTLCGLPIDLTDEEPDKLEVVADQRPTYTLAHLMAALKT